MSRYKSSPDGHWGFTLDAKAGTAAAKRGDMLPGGALADRAAERAGARSYDALVEKMPGLTRLQRDRERAFPRDVTAPPPHPRMARHLPAAGDVRRPLSSRQKKARSKTRREAAHMARPTERAAAGELIAREQTWKKVNGDLAAVVGDAQQLPDEALRNVQRVDRFIARYEQINDRAHVVYANLELNRGINRSNVSQFVANNITPGALLHCDQYTGAAHTLHQVTAEDRDYSATPVLEIETRRGAYVGHSDSLDNTGHLLPRGLSLEVVGHHWAEFVRPNGTTGQRLVIQARDVQLAKEAQREGSEGSDRASRAAPK